ncbi:MAG: hypothetical protein K1X55_17005 [Chitinophagales bacterium]|nr:hypothetical protein [Chitinophagales bacterium]
MEYYGGKVINLRMKIEILLRLCFLWISTSFCSNTYSQKFNFEDSVKLYANKYILYSDFLDELTYLTDEDYNENERELSLGFNYNDNVLIVGKKNYLLGSIVRNDSIAKVTLYSFKNTNKDINTHPYRKKYSIITSVVHPIFNELINYHKSVRGDSLSINRVHFSDFGFVIGKGCLNGEFYEIHKKKRIFSDNEICERLCSLYPEDRMWGYTIYFMHNIYDIKSKITISSFIEKEGLLNDNFTYTGGCIEYSQNIYTTLSSEKQDQDFILDLLFACNRLEMENRMSKPAKIIELFSPVFW